MSFTNYLVLNNIELQSVKNQSCSEFFEIWQNFGDWNNLVAVYKQATNQPCAHLKLEDKSLRSLETNGATKNNILS